MTPPTCAAASPAASVPSAADRASVDSNLVFIAPPSYRMMMNRPAVCRRAPPVSFDAVTV